MTIENPKPESEVTKQPERNPDAKQKFEDAVSQLHQMADAAGKLAQQQNQKPAGGGAGAGGLFSGPKNQDVNFSDLSSDLKEAANKSQAILGHEVSPSLAPGASRSASSTHPSEDDEPNGLDDRSH